MKIYHPTLQLSFISLFRFYTPDICHLVESELLSITPVGVHFQITSSEKFPLRYLVSTKQEVDKVSN